MLTLLISLGIAAAGVGACIMTGQSSGAAIVAGTGGFLITHLLISLLIRKKAGRIKNELENIMSTGQKQMNRKVQQFQSKPGGSIKQIQKQIEADQKAIIRQALTLTEQFKPFKKWNPLMEKQIATLRFQFLYQLKEFEVVDALLATKNPLSSPMLAEPILVAMKIARQYKNNQLQAAEKTFKRRIKWLRGDRGSLLYGLMSWIYMQEGEPEEARQLLIKAKKTTGNETLARNWEMLSNNKDKQFSNAGFGEEWYGLYLENPPAPKQKRMRGNAKGGRPF